jgi:hypothetical protein
VSVTTHSMTMATVIICRCIARRPGAAGRATGDDRSGATGWAGDVARCRFLDVFLARAPFSPPTSADTSNVQRTRRPARSRGILIARFDMAIQGASHVPGRFPRESPVLQNGPLQNDHSSFNSTRGLHG